MVDQNGQGNAAQTLSRLKEVLHAKSVDEATTPGGEAVVSGVESPNVVAEIPSEAVPVPNAPPAPEGVAPQVQELADNLDKSRQEAVSANIASLSEAAKPAENAVEAGTPPAVAVAPVEKQAVVALPQQNNHDHSPTLTVKMTEPEYKQIRKAKPENSGRWLVEATNRRLKQLRLQTRDKKTKLVFEGQMSA